MSKKNISFTLDEELINYLDALARANTRSRSSMLSWLLAMEMAKDHALDEEAKSYGKD